MAITFIYKIKDTPSISLDYAITDKECSVVGVDNKNDSEDSLSYIMRNKHGTVYDLSADYLNKLESYIVRDGDAITFKTLSSGINCSVVDAYKQMQAVRDSKNPQNGNKGVLQYCIVQNFGDFVDPIIANEIGRRFAEEYLKDYQCVVSTHLETGLVHNHIEFNATSFANGKKYNDNINVISQIRLISDRLCEEYDLPVLDATRDTKYIVWSDSEGVKHVFEPTDRKIDNIRKRQVGDASEYDVNSYVNTIKYEDAVSYKESNISMIRKDIDALLPDVNSYEELLFRLREIGYTINDKKKNGDWLKHISFCAPSHEKATRDHSLGDEYVRVALSQRILDFSVNKRLVSSYAEEVDSLDDVCVDISAYSSDIDSLSITHKVNNNASVSRRGDCDSLAVSDMVSKLLEVDGRVKYLNERTVNINKPYRRKNSVLTEERRAYLIQCIKDDIDVIRFSDNTGISGYIEFNNMIKSLRENKDRISIELNNAENVIKQLEYRMSLPDKVEFLNERIEDNKDNADYMRDDYYIDFNLMLNYKNMISKYGADDDNVRSKTYDLLSVYRDKLSVFNTRAIDLENSITVYNRYLSTLIRIAEEQGDNDLLSLLTRDDIFVNRSVSFSDNKNTDIKQRKDREYR